MPSQPTYQFAAMSHFFEEQSRDSSYTVYEIASTGMVNTSTFLSKTKAFDFARNFTNETSRVYVYKTKCIKVFDPVGESELPDHLFHQNVDMLIQAAEAMEDDTDPEYVPSGDETEDDDMPELESCYDLTGLTFTDYGKGYLLHPNDNTSFSGVKYLNEGWWNASQGGWFFRSQYYDDLVAAGATYGSSTSARSPTSLVASSRTRSGQRRVGPSPFESERDLSGFSIEPYGKGVIVRCGRSNPLYRNRTPYLLGNLGWWNHKGRGWFFQSQYVAELQRLGATSIKQEPLPTYTTATSSGRGTTSSRRTTRSSSADSPSFVTDDSQFFETRSTRSGKRSGSTRTSSSVEFEPYGRGWLLRESDSYQFSEYGKYFQGGFWMPQNSGWFFRNSDKEAFVA